MKTQRYDMIVIGAGPAGLSAAIEAAKCGLNPIVFDENAKPGGQLFKQIHKFFGSKEHKAKVRGFKIGGELLAEAEKYGVEVILNATVVGLYPQKEVTVKIGDKVKHYKGDAVLVATGASENMVNFEGWTKPGVIGAGAAQTMMNLHHIKPSWNSKRKWRKNRQFSMVPATLARQKWHKKITPARGERGVCKK